MITHNNRKYPDSKKLLKRGITILGCTTLILFFAPLVITKCDWVHLDVYKPNEIGDTIGGILGPLVGLIAVALTFLAFWAQYDANIQQRIQFDTSLDNEKIAREAEENKASEEIERKNTEIKERQEQFVETQELQQNQIRLQDKRARINIFETRFHTMLAIHRDNANEIEANNIKGRKVFIHMLDELKLIFNIFNAIMKDESHENAIREEELYNIVYLSFFFGIGEKSTPMVKDLVGSELSKYVDICHNRIINFKNQKNVKSEMILKIGTNDYNLSHVYSFGVGHLRRLSHYIRHLFQTVKFVDDQPNEIISMGDKYNYVSNLRAQLSAHEQILLFYNSISVMGKPWLDSLYPSNENYIQRYCMLKSIPLNAADFYKKPLDIFTEKNMSGKSMFEWVEIKHRMEDLDNESTSR
ncbi:putative phage abortive infection protein [Flavobacterium sp. WC2509]|uniref:putative phage abortive infection protein n=1 Tax=Flavobacterium sp. WC2509 TaxID=3461406 RepID=UPI004043B817